MRFDPLTGLIGPNGGGKSSVLRALELFYGHTTAVEVEDFYNQNTDQRIEIEVTFTSLTNAEATAFGDYVRNGELLVTRVISLLESRILSSLHGVRAQNPAFTPIRTAGSATAVREKYREFRQNPEFAQLPTANSQAAVLSALADWEQNHPDQNQFGFDEGEFFTFAEGSPGSLGYYTKLISIPAVRDASMETSEGRGRAITDLMDIVIRSRLSTGSGIADLQSETQGKYLEILQAADQETAKLADQISTRLSNYVPGAEARLSLDSSGAVRIQLPRAKVRLVEDGYETDVVRTGHGLQRAFIMALLQELAAVQAVQPEVQGEVVGGPNILLGIEEPEIYQHPSRQRRLAQILRHLSEGAIEGISEHIQVFYVTHSPLFAGLDRFEQLRMLRKTSANGVPRRTTVTEVTGDSIAERLWDASDRKDRNGHDVAIFQWNTLKPRLLSLMTPALAEGFFADVAVLVEGHDDRAAILGAGMARGLDLESEGFAIIPCGGKTTIDRPAIILSKFNVPVYLVWDSDKNSNGRPQDNHRLLRIMNAEVEDYPAVVSGLYACFENNLEMTIRADIGPEDFDGILAECMAEYEFARKDEAIKNPFILSEILRRAAGQGKQCKTLDSLLDALLQLKSDLSA